MRKRCLIVCLTLLLAAPVAMAQLPPPGPSMRGDGPAPAAKSFELVRMAPALDAIVDRRAKLELLASGFELNEGPVWVPEGKSGYLLVSGLLDNVIYRIDADKRVSVFMEKAGFAGDDVSDTGAQTRSGRSHVLLIGPSCVTLDSRQRVVWCADNERTVMRLEKDGRRTVLASGSAEGRRFSGPNDIAMRADDTFYLTDNDFGLRNAGRSPKKEMPNGIWLIREGAAPRLVLDDKTLGGIPNGVALSPDEKTLYANAGRKLFRHPVLPDGGIGAGILFAAGDGIGDGIKVDARGNVYSTNGAGPGVVAVFGPDGKRPRRAASAHRRPRAEAADLRHQSRVRRSGRSHSVHHGVRRRVSHPAQGLRRDAGLHRPPVARSGDTSAANALRNGADPACIGDGLLGQKIRTSPIWSSAAKQHASSEITRLTTSIVVSGRKIRRPGRSTDDVARNGRAAGA